MFFFRHWNMIWDLKYQLAIWITFTPSSPVFGEQFQQTWSQRGVGWRYTSENHSPEGLPSSWELPSRVLSRNKTTAPKAICLQCADRCAEFKKETTELKPQLLRFQINAAISELHLQYRRQLTCSTLSQTTAQFFSSQLFLNPPVDEQTLAILWSVQPQRNWKLMNCAAYLEDKGNTFFHKMNCFLQIAK